MSARNRDLARIARASARDAADPGRKAWHVVAVALDQSTTPEDALDIVQDMVTDCRLRVLATACLRSLLVGSAPASTKPQLTGGSQT